MADAKSSEEAEETQPSSVLSLKWSFGFNKEIVGGVHNLTDTSRNALFYVAAHSGVIYNFQNRTQTLLQGHCNPITCACASQDKRWIATADRGKDSMCVVWDSLSGTPIKTMFEPHPHGVLAMDLSPDAMFLVTLSVVDGLEKRQHISLWEWTTDKKTALYTAEIPGDDPQISVRFNASDIRDIVTNGKTSTTFWNWRQRRLEASTPDFNAADFVQTVGTFTQSIFLPNSTSAVTATVDGDVVLWDKAAATTTEGDDGASSMRRAVKVIRLSDSAILCLTIANNYLVSGSADGAVRFFDLRFRVEAWFEDLNAGPVTSVSFANLAPRSAVDSDPDSFSVADFVCGTQNALVVGVEAPLFEEVDADRRRGVLLVQGIDSRICGLAAHPTQSQVALSSTSGTLQLWDLERKKLLMVRCFESKVQPVSLQFEPSGQYLVQGMAGGQLVCLHPGSLADVEGGSFHHSTSAITDIRFSLDGVFMATADADMCVGIYYMGSGTTGATAATESAPVSSEEWAFLGKYKAHTAPITGLEFGLSKDGETPLLVSVSEDRHLVEYDLERSSIRDGILLKRPRVRIEQTATPTTCLWRPMADGKEEVVVTANADFKFMQWSTNYETCRHTSLGPTFGGPLNRLIILPDVKKRGRRQNNNAADTSQYAAYSTREKVVGIVKLPMDGNPNRAIGLIAHPGEISNIAVSHDRKYLITAGADDLTVNLWAIDTGALDTSILMGGEGVGPFVSLVEANNNDGGQFMEELKDYFCYAQLRMQGQHTTAERQITGTITLSEIPNMMRALGFYPTKFEIDRMCNEVKYATFLETGKAETQISLNDFIKLYVNYKPVFGVDRVHIDSAFSVLADGDASGIDWQKLVKRLRTQGEQLSKEELQACMQALTGTTEMQAKKVDSDTFATDVLGFTDVDGGEEELSA